MKLFTQSNKRLMYGSIIILSSLLSLDVLLNLNMLPPGFFNTNFLILLKGLTLFSGILIINRSL